MTLVLENLRLAQDLAPDLAIVIEEDRIAAILRDPPRAVGRRLDLGGALVTPPLVDLQVNGGDGLMLGEVEGPGDVDRVVAAQRRLGVGQCLPTLISDAPDRTRHVVDQVAAARARGCPGLLGLHLEGPHLTRAGAHDPRLLRDMTAADLDFYRSLPARLGQVMLTLAPERVAPGMIAALVAAGIVVALGHSDCSAEAAAGAVAEGATCATHLYNAMSGLSHRAPGLAARALLDLRFGLIADGVHVAPEMLALALRMAPDRAFLVSDGMATMGSRIDRFTLGGREIVLRDDRLTLADGTLAGAALPLWQGVRRVASLMGWPLEEAAALAGDAALRTLGLAPQRIRPGQPALLLAWPETGAPQHCPED